jgi:hypothetical protein
MKKSQLFKRIVGFSTVFAFLTAIVLFGLSTTHPLIHAQAQDERAATRGCRLDTIRGHYGTLGSGTLLGVGPYTGVGTFTPDGAGNFVTEFTRNLNGSVAPYSGSGTYTLESNCTGTFTLVVDGVTSTDAFVVVSKGDEMDVMSTYGPSVATDVYKKIN